MQKTSCSGLELSTEKTPVMLNGVTVGYVKTPTLTHKSKRRPIHKPKEKSAVESPVVFRTLVEQDGESGFQVESEMGVENDSHSEITIKETSTTNSERPKQEDTCFSKYEGTNKNSL